MTKGLENDMKKMLCILISALMTVFSFSAVSVASAAASAPLSVSVTPGCIRLAPGGTAQLFPTVLPATADRTLFYQSENGNIAKVNQNGLVTAISEGETSITVYCLNGNRKDTVLVTVSETESVDAPSLSPWNMATNTSIFAVDGYDRNTVMNGGNYQYATAYLSRWDGPVLESSDPYPYGLTASTLSPMDRYIEADAAFHIQGVDWLPYRTSWDDNRIIKEAVVRYGGVYAAFDTANSYFSDGKKTYYLPPDYSGSTGSHAVTIIGWDDDYPAENFQVKPAGNGAFLCRNSYGTASGDNGYLYISYYDKTFGKTAMPMAITDVESNENYDTQYCYDPYGAIGGWGPFDQSYIYGANIFPPAGQTLSCDQVLEAVSISTHMDNVAYELHIAPVYDGLEDFLYTEPLQKGVFSRTGYHTLRLKEPISLQSGTRFAVVFKLTAPSGRGRIYVEYPYSYVDSATGISNPLCISASAGYDEGYVSDTQYIWYDVAENIGNGNLCIRAFTSGGEDAFSLSSYDVPEIPDYMTESESVENGIEPHPALRANPPELLSLAETVSDSGMILPAKYDLRQEHCLPPVRDQQSWNTCWAHVACAQTEIFLMRAKNHLLSGDSASFDAVAKALETADIATSVTFEKEELSVEQNETAMLYRFVLPVSAKETPLTFESSNSAVQVDAYGNVTGVNVGTAVITCKDASGAVYDTCTVHVVENGNPTGVVLDKAFLFADVGESKMVAYSVLPAGTFSESLSASSDNTAVCTVDSYGRITAVAPGTATVTYRTENGKTDSVIVCVSDEKDGQLYMATQTENALCVAVENCSETAAELYVAAYTESGQLLCVTAKPVEKNFAGTVEIPLPDMKEKSTVKCMLLKDFSPLANVLELLE